MGVVVPAHDEEDLLPLCLASVREAAQALRGTEVHLVVVADACRDLTAQVARRGGASVVTVEARNVGTARAAGVREVLRRTRHLDPADVWLATTDADTVVSSGWLRQQARYAGQGWDAVAGTIEVTDWSGYRPETRTLFSGRYDGTGPHPHVHGAPGFPGFGVPAGRRVPPGADRGGPRLRLGADRERLPGAAHPRPARRHLGPARSPRSARLQPLPRGT